MKTIYKGCLLSLGLLVLAKANAACPVIFYGEFATTKETVSLCITDTKAVFERKEWGNVVFKVEDNASDFSTIVTKDITAIYFRDPQDHQYWYSLEYNKGAGTFSKLIDNNYSTGDHIPHIANVKTFLLKDDSLIVDQNLVKKLNTVANKGKG